MKLSARQLWLGAYEINIDPKCPEGARRVTLYHDSGKYFVGESPSEVWEPPSGFHYIKDARKEISRRMNRRPAEG